MAEFHLAVIPVGKVKGEDLENSIARVAKVLRQPVELRDSISVPKGAEDPERGQHRAVELLNRMRASVIQLAPGKMIGGSDPDVKAPNKLDLLIFVTDVDLYTARTDGVFGALVSSKKIAVTSIRRLREAFYRRPSDVSKQRSRLVKELLRMAGRLLGAQACLDPACVLAASKSMADVDCKTETYCKACSERLLEGVIRL